MTKCILCRTKEAFASQEAQAVGNRIGNLWATMFMLSIQIPAVIGLAMLMIGGPIFILGTLVYVPTYVALCWHAPPEPPLSSYTELFQCEPSQAKVLFR